MFHVLQLKHRLRSATCTGEDDKERDAPEEDLLASQYV